MEKMGCAASRGAALLVLLLLAMVVTPSLADCGSSTPLAACYTAVEVNGNAPSGQCCTTVNNMGLTCVCAAVAQYAGGNLPAGVDINRVLKLPSLCGVQVPANYQCAGYTVPS